MAKRTYKPTRYPNVFWRGEALFYRFRDADRKSKTVRFGLVATPREAFIAQQDAQARADAIRNGLIDPIVAAIQEHERKPISGIIDEFEAHLKAKNNTEAWVSDKINRVKAWAKACEVERLIDADPVRLTSWLAVLEGQNLSAATRNKYRSSVLGLLAWAVAHGRLGVNRCPPALIPTANEEADQRRISRAMTEDQVADLLAVAPPYRRLFYTVAACAGIRWGEISRLRWRDVDVEAGFITVPARASKNRRQAELPLAPLVVEAFVEYRELIEAGKISIRSRGKPGAGPDDLVVPVIPTRLTWQKDLARAGIVGPGPDFDGYRDAAGCVFDRKCLRTTFGTLLEKTGSDLRNAQKLMRHSSVELTSKFYSRARIVQLQADAAGVGEALTRAGRARGSQLGNGTEHNGTIGQNAAGA